MNSFVESLDGFALVAWHFFLVCGMAGGWVFVVLYWVHTKGQWIHGRIGRHLMAFSIAVSQALTAYMLRILLGDFPGREVIMFFALISLVFVVWWRTFIFLREARKDRRHEKSL